MNDREPGRRVNDQRGGQLTAGGGGGPGSGQRQRRRSAARRGGGGGGDEHRERWLRQQPQQLLDSLRRLQRPQTRQRPPREMKSNLETKNSPSRTDAAAAATKSVTDDVAASEPQLTSNSSRSANSRRLPGPTDPTARQPPTETTNGNTPVATTAATRQNSAATAGAMADSPPQRPGHR